MRLLVSVASRGTVHRALLIWCLAPLAKPLVSGAAHFRHYERLAGRLTRLIGPRRSDDTILLTEADRYIFRAACSKAKERLMRAGDSTTSESPSTRMGMAPPEREGVMPQIRPCHPVPSCPCSERSNRGPTLKRFTVPSNALAEMRDGGYHLGFDIFRDSSYAWEETRTARGTNKGRSKPDHPRRVE